MKISSIIKENKSVYIVSIILWTITYIITSRLELVADSLIEVKLVYTIITLLLSGMVIGYTISSLKPACDDMWNNSLTDNKSPNKGN